MDGYLQSTLVANSLQQNNNRKNADNAVAQVARVVPHFPPTNKDFNCTEIHTPDGIYPLLHETFYETIAPQYNIGTRATVVKVKDETQVYNGAITTESSEDEGLIMGASLTITPVKSAALPIPNAASTRKMSRTAAQPTGSIASFNNTNNAGLQILTSPQKLMIPNTTNGNSASPYSPYSPSYSATPSISQSQHVGNSYQPQQQFASGSYMMSSSHDLGFANLSISQQSQNKPESNNISSSYSNFAQAHHGHTSSVSSISSLLGRGANAMSSNMASSKSTSQLSSSIARSMSNSFSYNNNNSGSKPKNHLMKTNSTFVLRFLIHENLQKLLTTKGIEDSFLFFNMGSSFIWMDAKNTPKEPLSRIVFSKSYPTCHDMNETTRCDDHLDIIIGFSTGDIIWYDPPSCKYVRLNKGGSMVSSPVTMIKWLPGSEDLFIVIFKNGTALIMDRERDDQSFIIPEASSWGKSEFHAARPHRSSKYNPVSFWKVSERGLTDIVFSPDGIHLAMTGVDGQLRIIDFRNERLTDLFSSYYGKLSCVDWSPDGRYILTGGEDDLVTIWSFIDKRMVARCQGHKSWVTGVAFDRWRCDNETYRFGSVGEDCSLALWDFSYSALQKPKHPRIATTSAPIPQSPPSASKQASSPVSALPVEAPVPTNIPSSALSNQMERKRSLRNHRLFRGFTSSDNNSNNSSPLLGTSNSSNNSSSFNRFRKRSSRSNNIFNAGSNDYHDEVLSEEAFRQHAPVIHPVLKKGQAAILLPTTVRTIHGDPCLSLTFKENTLVTTDRRGRIRTWGRPQC